MTLPKTVYKAHGMGNDFIIYLDDDNSLIPTQDEIRQICDRHFGIGADGLIRLDISDKARSCEDKPVDAFMDYYNQDGTTAQMCGNGARVCMAFAKYFKKVDDEMRLNTRSGIKQIYYVKESDLYRIDMGSYLIENNHVNMGNPHIVTVIDDYDSFLNVGNGKEAFIPTDANYEYIHINEDKQKIEMRVWERGVGETLSCGTGICASAIYATSLTNQKESRAEGKLWKVTVPGGEADVLVSKDSVFLTAPAQIVAKIDFNQEVNCE